MIRLLMLRVACAIHFQLAQRDDTAPFGIGVTPGIVDIDSVVYSLRFKAGLFCHREHLENLS